VKLVQAKLRHYDAILGRVTPGDEYELEDAVAERWVKAGVADALAERPPPPPPPAPEPEPEEEPEEAEQEEVREEDRERLRVAAKQLSEEGKSQYQIAELLGISRDRVRRLLKAP